MDNINPVFVDLTAEDVAMLRPGEGAIVASVSGIYAYITGQTSDDKPLVTPNHSGVSRFSRRKELLSLFPRTWLVEAVVDDWVRLINLQKNHHKVLVSGSFLFTMLGEVKDGRRSIEEVVHHQGKLFRPQTN